MGRTGSAILFLLPSELAYLDVLNEYKIQYACLLYASYIIYHNGTFQDARNAASGIHGRFEGGGMELRSFRSLFSALIRYFQAGMQHLPEALHEFQRRCEEFVYSRQDVYEMATKGKSGLC